ncbi:hypothetical protein [Streptomyces sp. NPDC101165]|uniref:hypothetical protein n=1 Tax=Streptomyces sp. NPDC101165 TaxID=3366119 RepID=UPI0038059BCC
MAGDSESVHRASEVPVEPAPVRAGPSGLLARRPWPTCSGWGAPRLAPSGSLLVGP